MSSDATPTKIEETHYYVIQRRWNDGWVDSSNNYHGQEGLPAAVASQLSMAKIHGFDNVKMIRRDTIITEIEITTDVHTEHCCDMHGCKYGDDEACTVATRLKLQSHPCERCYEEIYEDGGWETAHLMNELYNKGFKKAETCGSCGLESGGLCYRCA